MRSLTHTPGHLCVSLKVNAMLSLLSLPGFCKEKELSLQKYEKTENTWLVCTTCSQATRLRKRKKLEWCASRCKKDKKFKCR